MREERTHSRISGTIESRLKAVQSTQLDLENLERELVAPVSDTINRGSGDTSTSSSSSSNKPTNPTLKQELPLLECSEGVSKGSQKNTERQDIQCSTFAHFEKDNVRPTHCASLGQLSDDTNENAAKKKARQKSGHAIASGTCKSKPGTSRRNLKSRSRCTTIKRDQPGRRSETSGRKVIELPPNSVLKITSRSALNVQKSPQKEAVAEQRKQSPVQARGAKRFKSCSQEQGSVKDAHTKVPSLRQVVHSSSSRGANRSNSSRYRVTPCPTPAPGPSWWSLHGSVGSASPALASSRTSSLTSAGTMRYRSSSTRSAAARARSPSRYKQKRYRRNSGATRSSSRLRRRRYLSEDASSGGVSSAMLLDHSSAAGSKESLRRNARKLSKISLYRARRHRRASSPRRGRSPRSRTRKTSPTQRKRGRPVGSGRKSRSSMSVTETSQRAQDRSLGLFDRVKNMWSSYSSSRSNTPAKSHSSTSYSNSWVSKMLPHPRSKHQTRLQRHREKAHRYSRASKDEAEQAGDNAAEQRRKRKLTAGDTKTSKKEKSGPLMLCRVM